MCASTLIALALFVAVEASAALPQRTFVASYGNDASPCSLQQPCRGFQAGINAVAAGGEVVAIDSAGYGAMEIHKSVSVIVPSGVHAGLSPSTGIPLPGYPGQFGVVLIDIQSTDVVVLRGLNIGHQGTVTGGIEWISANGGTVHVENVVVNGFPKEAVYVQAPTGNLFIKDSILRNNDVGIYGAIAGGKDALTPGGIYGDHVHIEHSTVAARAHTGVGIKLSNCTIRESVFAVYLESGGETTSVALDRCAIHDNTNVYSLNNLGGGFMVLFLSGSTIMDNHFNGTKTGGGLIVSWGNNSADHFNVDTVVPPT